MAEKISIMCSSTVGLHKMSGLSPRLDPVNILGKAIVEAEIWRELHNPPRSEVPQDHIQPQSSARWTKAPIGWRKWNVASSWVCQSRNSGGAWIVRDSNEVVLFHSRRAFSNAHNPVEAAMLSLLWAIQELQSLCLDKIIFETSSYGLRDAFLYPSPHFPRQMISDIMLSLNGFSYGKVEHTEPDGNRAVSLIASSVTTGHCYQSYVASGGPSWLQALLKQETGSSLR
ncbi:hypothetical protein Bca101_057096 [Brassica carinata]